MELQRLVELIKNYSPAHFKDVCGSLSSLSDELEYTKAALSKDLIAAQDNDNFPKAREILDVQEELSKKIALINKLLSDSGAEVEEHDVEISEVESTDTARRPDYNLYDMDDTVAYDIEDTPVTFKRLAAFSYKGKRYPVTKWRSLLSKLCDILYKEDPSIIKAMTNEARQPGKKRVKMSINKADIHSPVKIDGSDIWVETNRSAADIRKSILVLLNRYGIPTESVKIYFRRDYAALHADDGQSEED